MDKLRITFGNTSLARYPQGGGHWSVRLQYLLGLRDLGHDVSVLELLWSKGSPEDDRRLIGKFFERMQHYDLHEGCALLLFDEDLPGQDPEAGEPFGKSTQDIKDLISTTDLFINDCCGVRQPLLGMFRRRALLDLDPGHLQVPALTREFSLHDHEFFLSIGKKLHDADCPVPTLGHKWHTFFPFLFLPMWQVTPDPGPGAPFSSITHWTWKELWFENRVLSTSKREAYMRYLELPRRVARPLELAALLGPDDRTGDFNRLLEHGWKLVDPWAVAGSPSAYQHYISRSRAEICCPKPIFRELKTGWFSDRSACYLASGRPVLAEDTGFSDYLPTGRGLLAFRDMEEAIAGVAEIDANYAQHMQAARELAEEHLDSRRSLPAMLAACGY